MIGKEKYLEAREGISKGVINSGEWEVFYDFWTIHRKEEFLSPDIDRFIQSFTLFLQRTLYSSVAERVMEYYDREFNIISLLDGEGKQIKSY